jgi:hypothetical protein
VTSLVEEVGKGGVFGLESMEEVLVVESGTVGGVEGVLEIGGEAGACVGRVGELGVGVADEIAGLAALAGAEVVAGLELDEGGCGDGMGLEREVGGVDGGVPG